MTTGELIVNRVHRDSLAGHTVEQARELLEPELGRELAARVARNLADFDALARRDRDTVAALHEAIGGREPLLVPQLDKDVEDLLGLARIAEHILD
jgi:hypothetical protein